MSLAVGCFICSSKTKTKQEIPQFLNQSVQKKREMTKIWMILAEIQAEKLTPVEISVISLKTF